MHEESDHDRQVRIQKEVFRTIINEWMDEQFRTFGKWTMRAMMVLLFSVLVHLMFTLDPKAVQHFINAAAE